MRKIVFLIVFVLLFIVSVTFSAYNLTPVTVDYYFGTLTLPLSVILIVALLLGAMLGALILFMHSLKLRYENRRLQHRLAVSEQEINSLRILPIKDRH